MTLTKIFIGLVTKLSSPLRENIILAYWSHILTPMAGYCRPTIIQRTNEKLIVEIKLRRRVNTEFNSMFFAALATGFDITGGMLAQNTLFEKYPDHSVGIMYKDAKINFLKRADGDVYFVSEDGLKLNNALEKAISTKDRVNVEVNVNAYVHKQSMTDPVATATLTVSMKAR